MIASSPNLPDDDYKRRNRARLVWSFEKSHVLPALTRQFIRELNNSTIFDISLMVKYMVKGFVTKIGKKLVRSYCANY